jgi:alpha-galactosidase
MPIVTFIGAGSTVFATRLITDILSSDDLGDTALRLYDLDERRPATSETVTRSVAEALGRRPTIVATTEREHAFDGADYAICLIQVGGYGPSTVSDFEVPRRYGLRQTSGDTLGVGDIMRALRTIPVLLDMASDMKRLCPDVLLLHARCVRRVRDLPVQAERVFIRRSCVHRDRQAMAYRCLAHRI